MNNISIDIGGTNLRSAIITEEFKLINLNKNPSNNDILNSIYNEIIKQIHYSEINNIVIHGVGISIGGYVDTIGNILGSPLYENYKYNNLKSKILDKLKDNNININNIIIDNDGNCAAHCEKYYGNAIDTNTFITVVLGTGIGCGTYINNKIIQHSEFGYLIEDKCSGKYFDSKKYDSNYNETVLNGAKILGKKISEYINFINPEKVIFSGPLLNIKDNFKKNIKDAIYDNIHHDCDIVFSNINNQGLIGAICNRCLQN